VPYRVRPAGTGDTAAVLELWRVADAVPSATDDRPALELLLARAPEGLLVAETDDATLATAWEVSKKLAKRAVVVRDAPGFAASRLGLALGLEAMRMLEAVRGPMTLTGGRTITAL